MHSIEISIFNLWKQLPQFDIVHSTEQEREGPALPPPVDDIDERTNFDTWDYEKLGSMSEQYRQKMEAKYGVLIEPWDDPSWIQCSRCNRWFKYDIHIEGHTCIETHVCGYCKTRFRDGKELVNHKCTEIPPDAEQVF